MQTSLRLIGKVYNKILDETSLAIVLPSAEANVRTMKEQYDYAKRNQSRGFTPESWGYTIEHTQPLRFVPSKILRGVELQIDVYCDVRWEDDDRPVKQDIKVRIWSQHDETIFDPHRDSTEIFDRLADPERMHQGRVISRFHFDKANPDQKKGPEYHLQFGGKSEDYELCWHPKSVDIPRLEYHPMELFLTCQVIAANFFWKEYLEIREKREWREELILYQNLLLLNHYEKCLNVIKNHELLLDSLWIS